MTHQSTEDEKSEYDFRLVAFEVAMYVILLWGLIECARSPLMDLG